MVQEIKKIAVLTSGGDAPGMNPAIRAVVRKAIFHGLEIYGIQRGYEGLIHGEFIKMSVGSVADIIHRGGTILMTARSKEMFTIEGQKKAASVLKNLQIDGLIVIGGEGSFKGAQALSKLGVRVVGVPGTIDNDIPGTDLTIGFDTAVNTVVEAVSKVRDTATSHERTFVIEVMGRECGNIALEAGLAIGAESIIVPEIPYDIQEVVSKLKRGHARGKNHSIILVAEGAGSGIKIAEQIHKISGFETRVTVLGHLQRGGSPSALDGVLAAMMGGKAVDILREGHSDMMTAYVNNEVIAKSIEHAYGPRRNFDRAKYALADILAI